MTSSRHRVTRPLKCPGCGREGAAVWEDEVDKRTLMRLDGRFHVEQGRTRSADALIVCDVCDAFQPA